VVLCGICVGICNLAKSVQLFNSFNLINDDACCAIYLALLKATVVMDCAPVTRFSSYINLFVASGMTFGQNCSLLQKISCIFTSRNMFQLQLH